MNKREARIVRILDEMKKDPFVSIAELAELFSVSQMTIRRDLQYIEAHDLQTQSPLEAARREPAGIRPYAYSEEEVRCVDEKRRINEFAVTLLSPGDVIVLDSGTTTGMMPEFIPDDLPLTVICYSYYIVSRLCEKPNIQLILAGGYYHRNTKTFSSEEGIRFMRQLRAQKIFLCASGIHETMGLTCTDQYIGDLKKAAISMSLEKILISDSTKFGKVNPGYFAGIEDMDRIITDTGISDAWADLIRERGIRLDIV